jgi:alanine dehydrogenase
MAVDRLTGTRTATVTSHADPVFEKHGITHYGVTNMPGAYPRTSTMALTATTLPYVMQLAQKGVEALRQDYGFAQGVNTHNGYIICKPVAEAIGLIARFKDFSDT